MIIVALVLLFLEFFTLSFGISILFEKLNVFQIILHFLGVLHIGMLILLRYSYTQLYPILTFYVILPFLLEFGVVIHACIQYRIVWNIEDRRSRRSKALETEYHRRRDEAEKAQ